MNDETPPKNRNAVVDPADAYAERFRDIEAMDPSLGAYNFGSLAEVIQFSDLMSRADVMIPPIFRNKPAICAAVIMRAVHWKMDPFALAQEAYQAKDGGPVGFQAKVFVAALQTCAGITLNYRFEGEVKMLAKPAMSAGGKEVAKRTATGDRRCIAYATINGEVLEYETPKLDDITVKNSPMWHNDPDQQLSYYAGRGWSRRHRPGVIMGAYSADEVQEMEPMRDVTPRQSGFVAKAALAKQKADEAQAATADKTDDTATGGEAEADQVEDEVAVDTSNPAYREGLIIGEDPDTERGDCPYTDEPERAMLWFAGFDAAREAAAE